MAARNRASGTGQLTFYNGVWFAKILLPNGKKVVRKRRTQEDGETAIREMMALHADELGYHYRLAFDGKPTPLNRSPRRTVSPRLRWEVFERDDHRCQYCGAPAPEVRLVVDHIVAVVEGGSNQMDNLVTACVECNAGKGQQGLRLAR